MSSTSRQNNQSATPTSAVWVDAALWLTCLIAGGILVRSDFFRPFLDIVDTPALIGVLGFLGFIIYWIAVVVVAPSRMDRWRFVIVLGVSLLTIFGLTERSVLYRALSPHGVWGVSDGTVQIESAATALLHGQNPYTIDYENTAHGWRFDPFKTNSDDPARTHLAYPPGSVVLMVPVILVSEVMGVPPDGRLLSVLALIALWVWLTFRQKDQAARARITILTLGNPLLYLLAVAGFNDVTMVALLVGAAIFGRQGRWVWSAIFLALAVATKQTSWVFLPLWMWWFWWSAHRQLLRPWIPPLVLAGSLVLLFLPFVWPNPQAFLTDVVIYPAGALPATYSTSGPTIVQFLPEAVRQSDNMMTPIQVLAGFLGVLGGGLLIFKRPTAQWWLLGGTLATLLLSLVHQFFYYNYAIALLGILVAAWSLTSHDHALA